MTLPTSSSRQDSGLQEAISSTLFAQGDLVRREVRPGSYVYWGDASNYHEWEFMTRLRMQGKADDAYIEEALKVVDDLRGDALATAQGLDLEELWKGPTLEKMEEDAEPTMKKTSISGIDKLMKAMRAKVSRTHLWKPKKCSAISVGRQAP